jgi:AraC-like DNA-binding protein
MNNGSLTLQTLRVAPHGEWRHGGDAWCFTLIQRGVARFVQQNLAQSVQQGDVLLLASGIEGCLQPSSRSPLTLAFFHFQPEELTGIFTFHERLLFQQAAVKSRGVRYLRSGSVLADRFAQLTGPQGSNGQSAIRFKLLDLVASTIDALRLELHAPLENGQDTHTRVMGVLGKLGESELQNLSVDDLARRCGVSRRHLNRILHDQLGCSIINLKMRARLDRAATLLQDPETKILNVALDCGFNHLGCFTLKFKERFGDTPGRWRQKLLAKSAQRPPLSAQKRSLNLAREKIIRGFFASDSKRARA